MVQTRRTDRGISPHPVSPLRAWCDEPTIALCQWPPLLMARPSPASAADGSGAGAQAGTDPERADLIRSTGRVSLRPRPSSSDNLDLPAGWARVLAEVAPEAAGASADYTGQGSLGPRRRRWGMPAERDSSPGAGPAPAPGRRASRQKLAKSASPAPMGLRVRERGLWIAYG